MAAKARRRENVHHTLPLRVLLVEDSSLFRDRVAESIESPGRVQIVGYAISEKAALELLWSQEWDVLILDLQLKQGNGLGILKGLQSRGRPAHTKVIVLTNHDYYLYRLKTTECGADYFFSKTRDFHLVTELLERMVREKETAPS